MANRFSEIAKQMGANVDEEAKGDSGQNIVEETQSSKEEKGDLKKTTLKSLKKTPVKTKGQETEIPTTRKTTAIPLVLDIAIKEVKERRNIASKIKRSKKITEDDVVIEALELYFKKTENKSYLEAAYEKLQYLEP